VSDTVVDISPIPPHPHWLKPHPHPITMKFIPIPTPIPIKSAVLYISANNLTVFRRHKKN